MSADPPPYVPPPPSYSDVATTSTESYDGNEILSPTILVLYKQSIHAESPSSGPVLYQLNRGITGPTHATSEVEFSRVERTLKADTGTGEPVAIKSRVRHIYNIKYDKDAGPGRFGPQFFIRSVSRRTVGDLALRRSSRLFRGEKWKALPVHVDGTYGLASFQRDREAIFEVRHRKGQRYQWVEGAGSEGGSRSRSGSVGGGIGGDTGNTGANTGGNTGGKSGKGDGKGAIAVEDEGEDQHRLIVTASLKRETMDALVALWCCRIWEYEVRHNTEKIHEGMEGVRRKLRLANE
ncbi:hypothetical protein QBC46DRAFT_338148 [Diplogelasinospora grovesii]|uniref:Uncharacterized protein n=1 Tax=Diplogelasinospora grovesii TaxID=303347 RepID=A0AAN6S8D7_9PEZI|nr:hypothetical protein QBC46DRAFT_338148 [Diplogelasinospora grovesii]